MCWGQHVGRCKLPAWLLLLKTAWVLTTAPLMWVAIFLLKQRGRKNFMSASSSPLCKTKSCNLIGWLKKYLWAYLHPVKPVSVLRLCSSWLIVRTVRWPHLGYVVILWLNLEPLRDLGVSPLWQGDVPSLCLWGVLASQAETVPGWESPGRDEEQFPKLVCTACHGKKAL